MPTTARRNFMLIVLAAALPYGVLLLAGCGLTAYVAGRISESGIDVMTSGSLLPTTATLTLLATGVIAGGVSMIRQLVATRRLERHVALVTSRSSTHIPAGVTVVAADEPFAFTFGLAAARIAVSRGLVDQLSPQELHAVIAHERFHLHARDPLKLLIARVATRTCFFLPAVNQLMARYVAGRELAADRSALRHGGGPALAGALLKVVDGPSWPGLDTAAAMADHDLLAARIAQLEKGAEPPLPALTTLAVAVSAAIFGLLSAALVPTSLRHGLTMVGGRHPDATWAPIAWWLLGSIGCTAGWLWLARVAFRRLSPWS